MAGAALTPEGVPGTPMRITADGLDFDPVPRELVAATLKVYCLALVSPVTVCVVAVELNVWTVCGCVPMYGVTTYWVMATPRPDAACQRTIACAFPVIADTAVGADGRPIMNGVLGADSCPTPRVFLPATVNVYVVPFVRPANTFDVGDAAAATVAASSPPLYALST